MINFEIKSMKKAIGFGAIIWIIPFIVSVLIFSIHDSNRALFESIMPVTIVIVTVIFSVLYFQELNSNYFNEGIILGFLWFTISIVIDLFLFLPESPMQMSIADYMMDIGITYIIILAIPIGFGLILERSKKK